MLASLEYLGAASSDYPFTVPAIASLRKFIFSSSRLTFFVGENGSGKSTLLEAIALSYGLSLEGGSRNFAFEADLPTADAYPLARALKLGFHPSRSGEGFFSAPRRSINLPRGSTSLISPAATGIVLCTPVRMEKPRSPCSITGSAAPACSCSTNPKPPCRRSASFHSSSLLHHTVREYPDAQFLISTHSPILLGCPGAQILSLDDGRIRMVEPLHRVLAVVNQNGREVAYQDTSAYQVTRRLLADHASFLDQLLRPEPGLFDEDPS